MARQGAITGPHRIDVVTELLERSGVRHDVVEHESAYSARAAETEPDATAKTVGLRDRDGYCLAVPASERLNVRRAREALGATHHLRLATEAEMRKEFPAFDVGAIPPFVPGRLPEVVDIALLHHERIVCAGGEHERSVRIAPLDLLRLAEPRVADICEHREDREQVGNPASF
jgi:prolyl-tRNA editing enzyme YbaK/EbsC (Cys-tRNA(Pro) deacylase)